jgi:hypothetical protein
VPRRLPVGGSASDIGAHPAMVNRLQKNKVLSRCSMLFSLAFILG